MSQDAPLVKPDPNTSTSYIDPIAHCTFPRVSSQCCSAREELHKLHDLDYKLHEQV